MAAWNGHREPPLLSPLQIEPPAPRPPLLKAAAKFFYFLKDYRVTPSVILHCLQSAFSLKICLVLISASAIANNDVMLRLCYASALVYRCSRLRRSRPWVSRAVTLQRKIRDRSQSIVILICILRLTLCKNARLSFGEGKTAAELN